MNKQTNTTITASDFADFIKRLRMANGYSQEQVAKRAGLHTQTYYYIESKQREPKITTAIAILDALGAKLDKELLYHMFMQSKFIEDFLNLPWPSGI